MLTCICFDEIKKQTNKQTNSEKVLIALNINIYQKCMSRHFVMAIFQQRAGKIVESLLENQIYHAFY